MKTEIAKVTKADLSLVEDNSLNEKQLQILLKRTPKKYIKERPAKGGGKWEFVTGGYVKKSLNLLFGWDWDFEIMSEQILIEAGEVVVKGKLTCRSGGRVIVKMQYGNKEIMFRKGTKTPLSIGNDMKAAATDALKKCASEIGIAADIYNKEDFREVQIETEEDLYSLKNLRTLYDKQGEFLSPDDQINIERIIDQNEETSFKKAINILNKNRPK